MDKYIGRLLDDRYEILEILGTGGMAVVYKARCHRLNRLVAIKILKDEFARDEEFRRRFRAEGEAVAMLSHPNIVQVYDVSSSNRADYIVMELIDGISLKQYMEKRGSLNWKETLHFAMQIATGLEHAHSRSIVHRDIKPHNVMVLKNGSVKVMDFGIARVMSKSSTLTKEALGSVHYISPEQAKGSFTDNRSDIYSLGVVMYEMMTGRPPYDGESPVAVAIQHINGGAVLPSSLNPNIPKALEQIIRKAMALELKDRYTSATEMLRDMEEFRKDPTVVFSHKIPDQPTRPAIPIPNPSRPAAERVVQQRAPQPPRTQEPPKRRPPQPQPQPQPQPRRKTSQQRKAEERSRMTGIAVVICSMVVILSLVAILFSLRAGDRFDLFKKDKGLVDVPYLVGKVYSDEIAAENPGLVFRHLPQEYNSAYPAGQVIRQEPAGGSRVAEGTEVVITVSLGEKPPARTMEDLAGVTKEEAISFLAGQGFLTLVRNETSDVYGVDEVIRTEPSVGTPLEEGQTIYLWVSIGPKVVMGQMPDVIGMDRDIAVRYLNGLGFENIRFRAVPSSEVPGTVIYQSEKPDTEIDVTREILLEYAQDPSETEPVENSEVFNEFVSFPLPVREEPYELTIYREGILVLDPTVIEPGTNKYTLELKGRGIQTFELYIDGVLYTTKTVEFGANE